VPDYLFAGLPDEFQIGRYHSWVVDGDGFPSSLEVIAVSPDGEIMALRHRDFDVRGVQFHPESILTPLGGKIIENWLSHTDSRIL
ncbi:MAG: gamma-glutamyl-gamma-aminobutyrate hydrolase family protein, partial [Duncaniella sp.]|nr:gamma-glutamyl-gamma-aminobutyrate hydrolase family protein [Duncaniella sp.]